MNNSHEATFGAGCFWGVEEAFRKLDGVLETEVGYEGGNVENPTYEQVCTDKTGHAEVVHLTFDPEKISYKDLLEKFWEIHDPTQMNKQGPDIGSQYRSVIFYHTAEQKEQAEKAKAELQASGKQSGDVVTAIEEAQPFYRAEDYHQKYVMKTGRNVC
jgi:peptide-methionine (S)-S-oxide reductase